METEKDQSTQNPFLLLGFLQFAILGTLMAVFFPWSLLFCLFVYGMDTTKLLVAALLHDFAKTLWAILSLVFSLILGIFALVVLVSVLFN